MIATVYVARIDGRRGEEFLSLHTSYEGGIAAIIARGGELYGAVYGQLPRELEPLPATILATNGHIALHFATELLAASGWRVRLDDVPVHLDDPNAHTHSTPNRGRG